MTITTTFIQAVCKSAMYEKFLHSEGSVGDTYDKSADYTVTGATVDEVLSKVAENHGVSVESLLLDSCEETGRLDVQVLEDADGIPASPAEILRWQADLLTLYHVTYFYSVDTVTTTPLKLSK